VSWQTLDVEIDRSDVGAAEALLELAGAVAVSLLDAGDVPQLEPRPDETPLWPVVRVRALYPEGVELGPIAHVLAARFPNARATIGTLAERDWQDALVATVRPRRIGSLELLGADDSPTGAAGTHTVRLHMGFAFGTGEHPTTRLCLEWLDATPPRGATVLDYGCGSGVLALAALALGASRAWAVDDDPQALAAARANAALNAVTERLTIAAPDALPERRFDVVLANILAGTLISLAPRLAASTAPGGRIALSGILATQREAVEAAYAPYFEGFAVATADGWVRLDARRSAVAG